MGEGRERGERWEISLLVGVGPTIVIAYSPRARVIKIGLPLEIGRFLDQPSLG